jgi:hypothetical protein
MSDCLACVGHEQIVLDVLVEVSDMLEGRVEGAEISFWTLVFPPEDKNWLRN